MGKFIRFTAQDDGIGFLTLANPPVNALSAEMVRQLQTVIRRISELSSIHVLIITSTEQQFCVGLDLKEQKDIDREQSMENVTEIRDVFTELANLPVPTICGIQGSALGGGAELAISCDFRIMSEEGTIGFPEAGLGIIPGAGGTQRLPRLIGPSKAKYWIFTGHKFTAEEALSDGVVDFIVDDGTVLESAIELAGEMLTSGPLALRMAKNCINRGIELSLRKGLEIEKKSFEDLINTRDWGEGLSAFLEKRTPKWLNK